MKKNKETIFAASRRGFLKSTGAAVIGGTLAPYIGFANRPTSTGIGNTLKVGLIGCGGRGSDAAGQALQADPQVVLSAMADIFPDRLDASYKDLVAKYPEKVKVDKTYRFIGFDAYKKVIES